MYQIRGVQGVMNFGMSNQVYESSDKEFTSNIGMHFTESKNIFPTIK